MTTTSPKLRYLVGADADAFADGRTALTDEEYLVLGDKQTDEEWFGTFMGMFPMPVDARRLPRWRGLH